MGLDNGLVIRAKNLRAAKFLEENYNSIKDDFKPNVYEFGYWRKCWNVRRRVLDAFSNKKYDEQGGEVVLTISDLVTFRDVMKYFLDEKHWHEDGSSIWTWEESIRGIANTIYWITEFLQDVEDSADEDEDEVYNKFTDEDFEIFFYDSY